MTSEEKIFIVEQTSATHGRPNECEAHDIQALDLDHPSLVRYSRDDNNYLIVRGYLAACVEKVQKAFYRRSEQSQGMAKSGYCDTK